MQVLQAVCCFAHATVGSIVVHLRHFFNQLRSSARCAATYALTLLPRRERLHIKPEENAILFTEPTHNTKEVREKTVQMAFEHLKYAIEGNMHMSCWVYSMFGGSAFQLF